MMSQSTFHIFEQQRASQHDSMASMPSSGAKLSPPQLVNKENPSATASQKLIDALDCLGGASSKVSSTG